MKKTVIYILIAILLGMLAFSGAYALSQTMLLRLMKVEFDHAKIRSLNFNSLVIDIWLKFINVSLVDINVVGYVLSLYINDKFITSTTSTTPGYIGANAESIIQLTATANTGQVLGNLFSSAVLMGLLFDYSKVIIRLKGVVSINHRGVEVKDINVDIKDNLKNLLSSKPQTA